MRPRYKKFGANMRRNCEGNSALACGARTADPALKRVMAKRRGTH